MELVRAALCEDEAYVRDLLARSLRMEFVAVGMGLEVESFATGDELLQALGTGMRFDVFFLDIEMPGTNGIDLCRIIRSGGPGLQPASGSAPAAASADAVPAALPATPDALVIFISNKEELVFQSFEVQPFRFMRKSHFVEEQSSVVRAIAHELRHRRGHIISVPDSSTGSTYRVDANELDYVEVIGKHCHLHTATGELEVKCRLTDVEALLEGQPFLKPHRSYLVNCRSVYSMGRSSLVLADGTEIPISRNRVAEVKARFLEMMKEER